MVQTRSRPGRKGQYAPDKLCNELIIVAITDSVNAPALADVIHVGGRRCRQGHLCTPGMQANQRTTPTLWQGRLCKANWVPCIPGMGQVLVADRVRV